MSFHIVKTVQLMKSNKNHFLIKNQQSLYKINIWHILLLVIKYVHKVFTLLYYTFYICNILINIYWYKL